MRPTAKFWVLIGIAYALLIGGAVWGLVAARGWAISTLDNSAEQENWAKWQEDTQAKQDDLQIPESRRGHTSAEPPALILLRDYFASLVTTTVILGTFLFAFFVFVARGASRSGGTPTS